MWKNLLYLSFVGQCNCREFFFLSLIYGSFYLKIEEKIRISYTNQDLCILKISKNSLAFTFVVAHKQMYSIIILPTVILSFKRKVLL